MEATMSDGAITAEPTDLGGPGPAKEADRDRVRASRPPDAVNERVVHIAPGRGWRDLGMKEVWESKELVLSFAWRDVKVRYKQTFLGVAWAVLQPLVTMGLFYVVFHRVAKVSSDGFPYAAFAMAGVAAWVFISNGFTLAANGLVQNANLVGKIYFPRLALPVGSVLGCVVDLVTSLIITEVILLLSGVTPTAHLIFLPAAMLLAVMATLGLGAWLSALQVFYRDIKYVLPLLTQALLFATPIAYAASGTHGAFRVAVIANPLTGPVEAFRWVLLGRASLPMNQLAISVVATIAVLGTGLIYFRRVERALADVV